MGNCRICGQPAGFLKKVHSTCREAQEKQDAARAQGRTDITSAARAAILDATPLADLEARIGAIETTAGVPPDERVVLLVRAWQDAVDGLLEDKVLDKAEEDRLGAFTDYFKLPDDALRNTGAHERIVKAAILRDIMEGKIPERVTLTGDTLVNFQKGETVVWAFPDCRYLEDKNHRQFVGGSQGVSVRIMKGVYYRVGAFKGEPVTTTERVHVDTGWLFVTSKNIYFAGPQKSMRIAYGKILSFEPHDDGIGIMRDAASAKPQVFVTGDGWFTYNLVVNLARL